MSKPNPSFNSEMASTSSEQVGGGVANLFNPDQVVTVLLPHNPPENLPLITACFSYMETERDPFQASAYLCSILLCFFPDLINPVCEAFTDLGLNATIATTASERLQRGISKKPQTTSFTLPDSLVLLGQAVVVLYKNAQGESSYNRSMEARINTLRAHSGVPSSTYTQPRISFDKAKLIHSTLGSSFGLKRNLLLALMAASKGERRTNMVCSYLCDVLAWSGMTAIVFIYHALWDPPSPALDQQSMQVEVRNLEEAFDKIMAVDHPKYFKILNPPDETRVIEAYRFPTIIELAKLIISKRSSAYMLTESPRLSQLMKIHTMGPVRLSSSASRAMQYNVEFESEFEEEVMAYGLAGGLKVYEDLEEFCDDLIDSL